jgi:hypothetical protein
VLEASSERSRRRAAQSRAALWSEIGEGLRETFDATPDVTARLAEVEREVMSAVRTPVQGARELLRLFRGHHSAAG